MAWEIGMRQLWETEECANLPKELLTGAAWGVALQEELLPGDNTRTIAFT